VTLTNIVQSCPLLFLKVLVPTIGVLDLVTTERQWRRIFVCILYHWYVAKQ